MSTSHLVNRDAYAQFSSLNLPIRTQRQPSCIFTMPRDDMLRQFSSDPDAATGSYHGRQSAAAAQPKDTQPSCAWRAPFQQSLNNTPTRRHTAPCHTPPTHTIIHTMSSAATGCVTIRGGRIICPESGVDGVGDVCIVDGRVAWIRLADVPDASPTDGKPADDEADAGDDRLGASESGGGSGAGSDEAEVFDATGCIVVPGLIDAHAHVYSLATCVSTAAWLAASRTALFCCIMRAEQSACDNRRDVWVCANGAFSLWMICRY